MAIGRSTENWNHTASLMALLASIHTDPKSGKRPTPSDFHPYMTKPEPAAPLKATPELFASLGFKLKRPAGDA